MTMLALNVANQMILRLQACPSDDVLAQKEIAREYVEVRAYNPQTGNTEVFEITNLHHAKDGWGVDHLVGDVLGTVRPRYGQPEEPSFIRVTFLDNELEADPLSLK